MHCPKCQQPGYSPDHPCPKCKFSGDAALIEELTHLSWVLDDLESWGKAELPAIAWLQFKEQYETRKKNLKIRLGLRLPPFTAEEAQKAWLKLIRYEILDQKLSEWLAAGDLDPEISRFLANQLHERMNGLTERLAEYSRPTAPPSDADQLKIWNYVLDVVERLSIRKGFTDPQVGADYRAYLQTEIENLEITLGLRSPVPAPEVPAATPPPLPSTPAPKAPPVPPAPKIPLRERLWRSLLSERTLHAILFLGIFLLFTAAVSFVIWGWRDFSAPLRVAIPTCFTLLFFALGWFVRNKIALYRSGIALSAIAALLIPIDLYTVYVNFGSPPAYWAEFWLIASVICVFIYTAVALNIQSRFFGYLVGVAAGSAILATVEVGHQNLGLSQDWASAALSVLALVMLLVATALDRGVSAEQRVRESAKPSPSAPPPPSPPAPLRVFIDPFRYLALLSVGVVMPLTLAWRYLDRDTFDTLHTALAINWWIGGLVLGWGAIRYRSRSLGLLAIISLPVAVYLTQAGIFYRAGVNPAWQAFGLACLVPLYLFVGYQLSKHPDDPILLSHSRSAIGCGMALLVVSALWSLTDLSSGAAAASSHTILAGALVMSAIFWQRPRYLFGVSFFTFTAATFAMTELGITLGQSSVGWASLALIHILVAIYLGNRRPTSDEKFSAPLVIAGYIIAALAVLPPLYPYDGNVLVYTLGNWLGLTGWGAYLASQGQAGFVPQRERLKAIFHWSAALPLPIWIWILFENSGPLDFSLPLALSALSWGMFALGLWVGRDHAEYRQPWNLTALLVSVAAPIAAFLIVPDGFTPSICLLASGLLYFTDAAILNRTRELALAGLVTAGGYYLLLQQFDLSFDVVNFLLAILISIYFFAGLWAERQKAKPFIHQFLTPLYTVTYLLAFITIFRVYLGPLGYIFGEPWTDTTRLWGAATQILLAFIYLLYAWGVFKEIWAHIGVWLLAAGGGFIVIAFSSGQGKSAVWAAFGAIGFVLLERVLRWFQTYPESNRRQLAISRLVWRLYRNPLLVAGWTISIGAIVLALFRNLIILGGGRIQQIWAALGLLLLVGLYALSARLFRQVRFVWFAGVLVFIPWTILTNLGWFTPYRFTEPGFAVSWTILAWFLFLTSLQVESYSTSLRAFFAKQSPHDYAGDCHAEKASARNDKPSSHQYAFPLKVVPNILIPCSLLWGLADNLTSRHSFGLAIAFYGFAAWLDYRRARIPRVSISLLAIAKYLYPAVGLIPLWSLYWLAWIFPGVRAEHYGLLLLLFAPLGLAAGQWLKQRAPRDEIVKWYGLPAYLTAYASLCAGTVLVIHIPALLSMVLLYDAVLMIFSAWLFRNPLWIYPAAVLIPISLWITLDQREISVDRRGWWLIGLAAIYLSQAWLVRRAKLTSYSNGVLAAGLLLILIGLLPSSQDEIGAFWGYTGAVLLYSITAFWLRKPLILTLACVLAIVPYAVGLRQLGVSPEFYGLALFPGAVIALGLGWLLDRKFGAWQDFPWADPAKWLKALTDRLLGWWALPLYVLGFGFASLSPFFAGARSDLIALNFALLVPIFAWAIYRFRLRIWLAALMLSLHLAWAFLLDEWWSYPAYAWQRFAPITIGTLLAGLWLQGRRGEKSPLRSAAGWSQILYSFVLVDVLLSQLSSMGGEEAGALVSLINALVFAVFASVWHTQGLTYFSTALGAVALAQWLQSLTGPIEGLPVAFAYLALGYGVAGYVLTVIKRRARAETREINMPAWLMVWESPLQISGLIVSFGAAALTLLLGFDLAAWTARALLGIPFREIVDVNTVIMAVRVLSILGLLYLTTSVMVRRLWLGYLAVGMLLSGWMIYAFYLQQWDHLRQLQWYALPAGLYLLGVAYLEWDHGSRSLARWLDYAAIFLILGSLFWQTLVFGWGFALLMGGVGLFAFWWGSARRLRRFFYAGIVGVILATVGQLLNALQHINQWVTFGIVGLLLVIVGLVVERKRESLKVWQDTLDDWE